MSLTIHLTLKLPTNIYSGRITHNLGLMAKKANLYEILWNPKVTRAKKLLKPLRAGLTKLLENPLYYQNFNPPNDYGNYNELVTLVKDYITACEQHPKARIDISR